MTHVILRREIEIHSAEKAKENLKKIRIENNNRTNAFWQIKAENESKHHIGLYDTITEEGEKLLNPPTVKTYIAHYYETLYTARKGEDTYEESTKMIKKQVKKNKKEVEKLEDIAAITDEEPRNAINKLRKRKALGPDGILNEALIETDNHTRHFIKEALNMARG